MQLQLHYTNYTTPQLQLHHATTTTTAALHHTTSSSCGWPTRWPLQLQPLQPLQKTQLQPPFSPAVDSLCHPWVTTTNLSYRFPIFETSAAALCGTTGTAFVARPSVPERTTYFFWRQRKLSKSAPGQLGSTGKVSLKLRLQTSGRPHWQLLQMGLTLRKETKSKIFNKVTLEGQLKLKN